MTNKEVKDANSPAFYGLAPDSKVKSQANKEHMALKLRNIYISLHISYRKTIMWIFIKD